MIIEEKMAAILSPVFNGDIFPVKLKEPDITRIGASGTYAIFLKVGGEDFSGIAGDLGISRPRIQISIYTIEYGELKRLEKAVNDVMKAANDIYNAAIGTCLDPSEVEGALPNVSVSIPIDADEPETDRYGIHMDFYCWVNE